MEVSYNPLVYTFSVVLTIIIIIVVVVVVVVVSWYRANMQKRYKNVPTTLPRLPAHPPVHIQLGKPQ